MTVSSIRRSRYSCLISLCVMISLVVTMVITPRYSYAQGGVLGLPQPGTMVDLSRAYVPLMVTGLTIHPENPLLMDFIVSTGNSGLNAGQVKKESDRLIKYFLACLTIPENDQWVNLSPYEKQRIVPEDLGQTVLGRDMLAQDYLLKQLTASLIYPEKNLGKNFWDKVYAKASEMYGTTQIPVNTFNKVWILPDTAKVYEHKDTVFVVKSHLKVMLDEDYLSLEKHSGITSTVIPAKAGIFNKNDINSLGSQIVRQIVLPAIEQEVNTGKNFAQLRQIYNSMILAVWFKKNLKQALLNQVYTDKSKINGVNVDDPAIKEKIYKQYLQAYKRGVFNYIKEGLADSKGTVIPRKYFSGGIKTVTKVDLASLSEELDTIRQAPSENKTFDLAVLTQDAKRNSIISDAAMTAEVQALPQTRPAKFGTSGDRGIIDWDGTGKGDFSIGLVQRDVQGIAEHLLSTTDQRTIIIGYDTRRRNPDFSKEAARIMAGNGFKVLYIAHEAMPTPVLAILAANRKVAGVINFTASHSPYTDGGLKFSPGHGGAADTQTTDSIEKFANAAKEFKVMDYDGAVRDGQIIEVDPKEAVDEYVNGYLIPTLQSTKSPDGTSAWDDIVNYVRNHPEFYLELDPMQGTGVRTFQVLYGKIAEAADRLGSSRYSVGEFKGEFTVHGLVIALRNRGVDISNESGIQDINDKVLTDRGLYQKYPDMDLTNEDRNTIARINNITLNELMAFNRSLIDRGDPRRSPKNPSFFKIIHTDNGDPEFKQTGGAPQPAGKYIQGLLDDVKRAPHTMGIAIDGDVDRFGVVDFGGKQFEANEMIGMFAWFLRRDIGLEGSLVKTVATSNFSNAVAKHLNMKLIETPVGFKYAVQQVMNGENVLVAGEESAHVAIGPFMKSWDDGFAVGLTALWLVARSGKTLAEYKSQIEAEINQSFVLKVHTARDEQGVAKANVIALIAAAKEEMKSTPETEISLAKKAEELTGQRVVGINTMDGVKLVFQSGDSILMRPSGTEPAAKLYVEVSDPERLDTVSKAASQLMGVDQALLVSVNSNNFEDDSSTTLRRADKAAIAPGGIDLASRYLKMQSEGEKVNITFDPAMIAQFKRGDFSGVKFRILDVVPVDLMPLLGLR